MSRRQTRTMLLLSATAADGYLAEALVSLAADDVERAVARIRQARQLLAPAVQATEEELVSRSRRNRLAHRGGLLVAPALTRQSRGSSAAQSRRETMTATQSQIETIARRAYNDTAREMAAEGVVLSHEQADELGQEALAWIGGRLGLNVRETDGGVECRPPRHYALTRITPRILAGAVRGTTERWWERRMSQLTELRDAAGRALVVKVGVQYLGDLGALTDAILNGALPAAPARQRRGGEPPTGAPGQAALAEGVEIGDEVPEEEVQS